MPSGPYNSTLADRRSPADAGATTGASANRRAAPTRRARAIASTAIAMMVANRRPLVQRFAAWLQDAGGKGPHSAAVAAVLGAGLRSRKSSGTANNTTSIIN